MKWSGPRFTSRLLSAQLKVAGHAEHLRSSEVTHIVAEFLEESDFGYGLSSGDKFVSWLDMAIPEAEIEELLILGLYITPWENTLSTATTLFAKWGDSVQKGRSDASQPRFLRQDAERYKFVAKANVVFGVETCNWIM